MANTEINQDAVDMKKNMDTAIAAKTAEVKTELNDNVKSVKETVEANKEATDKKATELEQVVLKQAKSIDDLANTMKDYVSSNINSSKSGDDLLDGLKSLDFTSVKEGKGKTSLEIKSLSYGSTGVEGQVPFEYRVEDIKREPHHKTRARNIVMTGATSGDLVRFNQNTSGSNPAAGKLHGASFAEYAPQLDNKEAKVITYGAKIVLNEEQLDDVLGLRSFITNQLMGYLMDTEDALILEGGNTTTTFDGIYTAGTAFAATQVIGATANLYDVMLDSAAQLAARNYNLDCVVLHSTDYWHLATIKTNTGQYALRTFDSEFGPKVMGANIYWNNGLTSGRFVAFDKMATQFWMREGATVEFFRANDDFDKNNVSVRVKARGCVTNFLPNGIVQGVISTAITDLTS